MPSSLTLGHVWDIPIRAHWSFLLVLPLFAYMMGQAYFAAAGGAVALDYVWGGALAVALFASVVAHELGHSWTARRYGVPIRSITLLPIGGVAQMKEMPEEPSKELRVALAGPLVSFGIGLPVAAVHTLGLVPAISRLPEFVFWAGYLNVFLGGFNLLVPAFPMDGGRVLRAALSGRMGRKRATEIAGAIGQAAAVVMGIGGFFLLGSGGWILLLIALFIWLGAKQEVQQVRAQVALGGVTVGDAMSTDVAAVGPGDDVADLYATMRKTRHRAFPVVEDGAVVGVVGLQDVADLDEAERETTRVEDVMRTDLRRSPPDRPARDLLQYLSSGGQDRLVVVEGGDGMVGVVSRTDLVRLIQILEGS